MASAGASIYNATKFGLRGFGFALNEELRTGVGSTTVFPGFIRDAGMFADAGVKLPRASAAAPRPGRPGGDQGHRDEPRRDRRGTRLARLGARLFGSAPRLVSSLNRRLRSEPLTDAIAEGQREKRRRPPRRARPRTRANELISADRRSGWSSGTNVHESSIRSRRPCGKSRASRSPYSTGKKSFSGAQATSTGLSNSPKCRAASCVWRGLAPFSSLAVSRRTPRSARSAFSHDLVISFGMPFFASQPNPIGEWRRAPMRSGCATAQTNPVWPRAGTAA